MGTYNWAVDSGFVWKFGNVMHLFVNWPWADDNTCVVVQLISQQICSEYLKKSWVLIIVFTCRISVLLCLDNSLRI
jgi:hypothetical protein